MFWRRPRLSLDAMWAPFRKYFASKWSYLRNVVTLSCVRHPLSTGLPRLDSWAHPHKRCSESKRVRPGWVLWAPLLSPVALQLTAVRWFILIHHDAASPSVLRVKIVPFKAVVACWKHLSKAADIVQAHISHCLVYCKPQWDRAASHLWCTVRLSIMRSYNLHALNLPIQL